MSLDEAFRLLVIAVGGGGDDGGGSCCSWAVCCWLMWSNRLLPIAKGVQMSSCVIDVLRYSVFVMVRYRVDGFSTVDENSKFLISD